MLLFIILAMVVGAGAGYELPRAYATYVERNTVWGTDINHEKPWGLSACHSIANAIMSNAVMQEAGASKTKTLLMISSRLMDGEEENVGEVLRELSDAWDKGNDAKAFYLRCAADFQKAVDAAIKKKEGV